MTERRSEAVPPPELPASDGVPGPSSARLFLLATLAFVWTAASLFLELSSRPGLLGRIGWTGLLGAGPVAVGLVILALRRYSHEVRAAEAPQPASPLARDSTSKAHRTHRSGDR